MTRAMEEVQDRLEALAVAELAVASYYAACSSIGGVFGRLCANLQQEEIRHASYLRTLQRWVKEHPERFHPGRHYGDRVIQEFIQRVRTGVEQVKARRLGRTEMLHLALAFEDGLIENQPWEVLRSFDPDVMPMLRQIQEETEAHRMQLEDQLRRAEAA